MISGRNKNLMPLYQLVSLFPFQKTNEWLNRDPALFSRR